MGIALSALPVDSRSIALTDHLLLLLREIAFKGWDGWQDLPRIIYKVRDQLSRCPPNKLERFLSRALRRNNPQFSIPE